MLYNIPSVVLHILCGRFCERYLYYIIYHQLFYTFCAVVSVRGIYTI